MTGHIRARNNLVATGMRRGETVSEAVRRVLSNELGIEQGVVVLHSEVVKSVDTASLELLASQVE